MFNWLKKQCVWREYIPIPTYTTEQVTTSRKLVEKLKADFKKYPPIEWTSSSHYPFPTTYDHKKCDYYLRESPYTEYITHYNSYDLNCTTPHYIYGLVHAKFDDHFTQTDAIELLKWFNTERDAARNEIKAKKSKEIEDKLKDFLKDD